jgi:hypothetical protein
VVVCLSIVKGGYRFSAMMVTISRTLATMIQENIIKALSVWLSVLTSLVGALSRLVCLGVFIGGCAVALCVGCVWLIRIVKR